MRALVFLIALTACAQAGAEPPVATPSTASIAASAIPLMAALDAYKRSEAGAVLLVDVRTPEEWAASGIAPTAHGLTLQDPNFASKLDTFTGGDKSKPIAFICRSGNRSGNAAERAREQGYTDVYNVPGGMMTEGGWIEQGLPVVSGGQ